MSGIESTTDRRRKLGEARDRISSADSKNDLIGGIDDALGVSAPVGDVATIERLGKRYAEQVDDAGLLGERVARVAKQGLPEAWVGETSVLASDVVAAAGRAAEEMAEAFEGGARALLLLADLLGEAQARDGDGRGMLREARGMLGSRDGWFDNLHEDDGEERARLRARALATSGADILHQAACTADDAARDAARDLNKWASEARAGKLQTDGLTAADRLMLADTSTGAGDPEMNEILSASDLQRAGRRMDQLDERERAAMDEMLSRSASPEERAYLMKALAAGNSIEDIRVFHEKIQGQSPDWLQRHLAPVVTESDAMNDEGRNPDGSNVNQDRVQFNGQGWVQGGDGSEGTCVSSSVLTSRAMVDPVYALALTGGPSGQEDDPGAFRQRLVDEQHRLHEEGDGGDDWNGMDSDGYETISDSTIGRATGNDYDYREMNSDDDRREILPDIQRSVAEGRPVPIAIERDGGGHALVVVGQEGDMLQVYNPWGHTTWISEDDFINGNVGGLANSDYTDADEVYLPK
ncbi:peptidoglycan-binding protein [Streptomyces sp. NPDC088789]|uniref:peptidoglycan-binding protein n=1 Tax=Streptomyces sp. NPDC088789 TaxID=3365899 RepID=UPI0037FD3954